MQNLYISDSKTNEWNNSYVLFVVYFETQFRVFCFGICAVLSISKHFRSLVSSYSMAPINPTFFVSFLDKILSASNTKLQKLISLTTHKFWGSQGSYKVKIVSEDKLINESLHVLVSGMKTDVDLNILVVHRTIKQ
jgi:hypothetical protein